MNTPINFELAKLLKEKGFDIPTKKYYEYALKSKKDKENGYSGSFGWKKGELNLQSDYFQNNSKSDFTSEMWYMCSSPTIAEVVMWLYEKHGIWTEVNRVILGSDEWGYGYVISYLPKEFENAKRRCPHLETIESFKEGIGSYIGAWNSPTEAYESAIEYTLNNLI